MNHLDRKNKKNAKKLRQQEKKKVFATESNEKDAEENEAETETAVQDPNETTLQDSDQNKASETNNNVEGFEKDTVDNDDENEDLPKFKKTENVLEMSASELSKFLEEIVENHIKSKRKINSDLPD